MGQARETLQFIVFALNLFLVGTGIGIVIFGIVEPPLPSPFNEFDELKINAPLIELLPKLIASLGLILFMASFVGCWGTLAGNSPVILVYVGLLSFVVLLELAMVGYVFYSTGDVLDIITDKLYEFIKKSDALYKGPLHTVQTALVCCGIENYKDWIKYHELIPYSCCDKESVQDSCTEAEIKDRNSCEESARSEIRSYYLADLIFLVIILVTEGLAIACSLMIYRGLLKQEEAFILMGVGGDHQERILKQVLNPSYVPHATS